FREDGMIVADINLTPLNIPADQRLQFRRELLSRVRAVPGVSEAADVGIVPISGNSWNQDIYLAGGENRKVVPWFNRVSPGYFETMRTPLLAGRDFNAHDTSTSPKVAIVNETFARKFLSGANPVGITYRPGADAGKTAKMVQIIGLVRDSKYSELRE